MKAISAILVVRMAVVASGVFVRMLSIPLPSRPAAGGPTRRARQIFRMTRAREIEDDVARKPLRELR